MFKLKRFYPKKAKYSYVIGGVFLLAASVPALAETLELTPSKDNTIFEDILTFSGGISSFTFTGPIASGSPRRTLWQFDLSAIPQGSQITSASVTFVINRAAINSSPSDVLRLHKLTASWGEGASDGGTGGGGTQATPDDATWAHRFFGNLGAGVPQIPWTTPGGDFIPTASGTINAGGAGTYTFVSTPELRNDVSSWVNNPATNFGWILVGPEGPELSQKAKRIISRESPSVAERPRLTIEFNPPAASVSVSVPFMGEFGLVCFCLFLLGLGYWKARRRVSSW